MHVLVRYLFTNLPEFMNQYLRFGTWLGLMLPLICTWAQGLQIYGLQYLAPQMPNNTDFELVQIDPLTANTTSLYTIEETKTVEAGSAVFDHGNQRYLFWGTDDQGITRFYNAATDTPLWIDVAINGPRPLELQHDLQSDRTYGLLEDQNGSGLTLVELDQSSGSYSVVATLPSIRFVEIGSSTFDSNHHRYFFMGIDASNFAKRIYALDVRTGDILTASKPLSASRLWRCLQYDLNTDQLLGLYSIPDPNQPQDPVTMRSFYDTYLAEADSLEGTATLINTNPVLSGYRATVIVGSTDLDQLSRILVASVFDEAEMRRLLVIQASDGSLISDAAFSQSVFELTCDNHVFAQQTYQGSTSRAEPRAVAWRLWPNPTADRVTLQVSGGQAAAGQVLLLDGQGRRCQRWVLAPGQRELRLSLTDRPAGVYMVQVQRPGQAPFSRRLIKQ